MKQMQRQQMHVRRRLCGCCVCYAKLLLLLQAALQGQQQQGRQVRLVCRV
jgi:hypothetical protein